MSVKESAPILDSPYYLNYLYYFNVKRDFFECHEHGEYLWLNSGSGDFLKGLIQLAVSLYHLSRGNRRGAAVMLSRGVHYLQQFPAMYEGIQSSEFTEDMIRFHSNCKDSGRSLSEAAVAAQAPVIKLADPELVIRLHNWHPVELPEES
ncbi:MAG: hypothetical protein JWN30_1603 [Bacilli bacterium]|nr:hypothetical protein [Bacilli bacterium]